MRTAFLLCCSVLCAPALAQDTEMGVLARVEPLGFQWQRGFSLGLDAAAQGLLPAVPVTLGARVRAPYRLQSMTANHRFFEGWAGYALRKDDGWGTVRAGVRSYEGPAARLREGHNIFDHDPVKTRMSRLDVGVGYAFVRRSEDFAGGMHGALDLFYAASSQYESDLPRRASPVGVRLTVGNLFGSLGGLSLSHQGGFDPGGPGWFYSLHVGGFLRAFDLD